MTQKEYIKKLRFYLALRLPHAELSDIVSDMEELFAGAAADGKSEAQICLSLGTSKEAARTHSRGKGALRLSGFSASQPIRQRDRLCIAHRDLHVCALDKARQRCDHARTAARIASAAAKRQADRTGKGKVFCSRNPFLYGICTASLPLACACGRSPGSRADCGRLSQCGKYLYHSCFHVLCVLVRKKNIR